jgi:hypothetical protein
MLSHVSPWHGVTVLFLLLHLPGSSVEDRPSGLYGYGCQLCFWLCGHSMVPSYLHTFPRFQWPGCQCLQMGQRCFLDTGL